MIGIDDVIVGAVAAFVASETMAGVRGMKNCTKRISRYQLERELVESKEVDLKTAAFQTKADYPELYKELYVPPTIIFRRDRKEYLDHHEFLSWLHEKEYEEGVIYDYHVS